MFVDRGHGFVTVALATDCNPGSSYTTSMSFCIAVAVRDMGFTPAEAVSHLLFVPRSSPAYSAIKPRQKHLRLT